MQHTQPQMWALPLEGGIGMARCQAPFLFLSHHPVEPYLQHDSVL